MKYEQKETNQKNFYRKSRYSLSFLLLLSSSENDNDPVSLGTLLILILLGELRFNSEFLPTL